MDNQQGKINDLEMGWLAGLLDGEGCIDFQQSKKSYYPIGKDRQGLDVYYYPRIRISMTSLPTLTKLTDLLRQLGFACYISWRNPTNKKWASSWSLTIGGIKRVEKFLIYFTPFLVTKRQQAENMLDFVRMRIKHSEHDGYSLKEQNLIKRIRNR